MKGLILSGGRGTRLRPLTFTRAKQLVPIANKPILFYGLEAMREAGITEIGIIVGDTADEIRAAVGDGSAWGVRVSYLPQEAPLGLAHAVLTAEPFLKGAPFVMYLGDNILAKGIVSLVDEFRRERPTAQILLARVPNPEQFGVAELNGDRVVRLEEKPETPRSDLALVGVYMFDEPVFEAARSIRPSFRNELEITDAIQYLIDHGHRVQPHVVDGWWKDTGKLDDMLEANRLVLEGLAPRLEGRLDRASRIEGKVVVEEDAEIVESVIRGPAIIGARSRIEQSYVGPFTSIHHDVHLRRSEVEHSIILAGSSVLELPTRMADSLLGQNVRIERSRAKPSAFRFMLGDNSLVDVI
jgi:glucose-1-phosphate thymidylyltransferase